MYVLGINPKQLKNKRGKVHAKNINLKSGQFLEIKELMPKTQMWPSRPLNTLLLVLTNYIINTKHS